MSAQPLWQFWIDVGGTFTDCVGRAPDGTWHARKVLSSGVVKGQIGPGSLPAYVVDPQRAGREPIGFWNGAALRVLDETGAVIATTEVWEHETLGRFRLRSSLGEHVRDGVRYELSTGDEAPILAIRLLLGLSRSQPMPPVIVRLGTTRGTNALLTRRGARTAFVTTRGFADVLRIGYQNRPRLFDLNIRKPEPLYECVAEIDERLAADGSVLKPLDEAAARRELQRLREQGVTSLAICLLHAYLNPAHELRLAELAAEAGFDEVSLSSHVAPRMKIVPRGDTTVVDAYLNPILREYVTKLERSLPGSQLRLLTSAGGLVAAEHFTGKDSILSGPAGGVVGMSRAALAAGFPRAVGFDMGGTSTDVARFDGRLETEFETEKAGVRIAAPMLAIETVAAGGGSICRFDGARLLVGPESAGADPGPACYGRGGPLTVTDVNFYLGRIDATRFPFPLDRAAVERRLEEVARGLNASGERTWSLPEIAAGFVRIANAAMARAIRSVSLAKGYDPRDYVLVAFGGAAAQHACATADELGMTQVLVHPFASLLSAVGAGLADVSRRKSAPWYRLWNDSRDELAAEFARLEAAGQGELLAEGTPAERISFARSLELRYRGVDAALVIAEPADGDFAVAFAAEHQRLYGYLQPQRPIEVTAVHVETLGRSRESLPPSLPIAGKVIEGPAILPDDFTCTVVEPGWRAEVRSDRSLLLTRVAATTPAAKTSSDTADPILLEVFHNLFTGVAEQMGHTLRNTAGSVNVKERLDFSCALFTATGDLVVNAPHIPVHLGAMGETVRRIIADNPELAPGDVFVTNDPYRGGSHLPDVTVVTPVFHADETRPRFFVANRAHHAEIGGTTPGSMPPFSRNLAEEGVLIRNFKLFDAGAARFDALRSLLTSGPYPSRAVEENLADLSAQVAANRQGVAGLARMIDEHSLPVVEGYMRHIQATAERKMRRTLAALPDGERRFADALDDGTPIVATLTIRGDAATIDFTGAGPVSAGNLNANRAITTAAVLYTLRLLVGEDVPLNQGLLAPVTIVLPECILNPPAHDDPAKCPAVVGGNVETSQRVVDVLLGAFGLAAASQGTMNNLLFGDATFGYYETICGGAGATADAPGADAVHTHMTNTRLTDPEVFERRFPVRLKSFAIRRGSGGAGQHRGGDGVAREIEFLQPVTLSLVTQRRERQPYGLKGGEPGAAGRNQLQRASGEEIPLPGITRVDIQPGDTLTIETPGGGGWGMSDNPTR